MIKQLRAAWLLVLIVLVCSASAYSKGSPDLILIARGAERPIEITDRETLKQFDPWSGQFIDWQKGLAPIQVNPKESYQVFFYLKWPGRRSDYDRGALKMIYEVWYRPSRDGGPGFVYLPGKGEEFYNNNTGTIFRDGEDGKWHYASHKWDELMKRMTSPAARSNRSLKSLPTLYCSLSAFYSLISLAFGFI